MAKQKSGLQLGMPTLSVPSIIELFNSLSRGEQRSVASIALLVVSFVIVVGYRSVRRAW
jgi:hypothetical protein